MITNGIRDVALNDDRKIFSKRMGEGSSANEIFVSSISALQLQLGLRIIAIHISMAWYPKENEMNAALMK